jgi:hypothetical protein
MDATKWPCITIGAKFCIHTLKAQDAGNNNQITAIEIISQRLLASGKKEISRAWGIVPFCALLERPTQFVPVSD